MRFSVVVSSDRIIKPKGRRDLVFAAVCSRNGIGKTDIGASVDVVKNAGQH